MALDLKKISENFDKALSEMTQEDIDRYFPKDTRPKGWISIEDHLPMMYAMDFEQGCSEYKVKLSDGTEEITCVSDHNIWYYMAKEAGITHWWNE